MWLLLRNSAVCACNQKFDRSEEEQGKVSCICIYARCVCGRRAFVCKFRRDCARVVAKYLRCARGENIAMPSERNIARDYSLSLSLVRSGLCYTYVRIGRTIAVIFARACFVNSL